ncbi:hypothetical protein LTR36_010275 [Oleoguttula mirabilis]|uniref:Glutamine amidotransferase type-2 domain-containing protein n=1 Tax=Oleoguttula mirabilis TaxID=1507867 RepID=A0AAV9J5F3_9PEZI|nr:hypothetical protein LTR36_010275 [Oleoguttula mirabilis]
MCGISAVFDLRKRQQDSNGNNDGNKKRRAKLNAQLDRSVESQRHRGPDDKGVWINPENSAGLGHVRLSTRDLSCAGHQPLHSSNGADDLHIVVNGELYYDEDLRASLEQEYDFQSTSDSEIVIPLYRRYGVAFIDHLRGEFSLVLYDAKTQTLIAARDRLGVKPLHYGVFDGRLLIATQCKGIAELLDDPRSLHWDVHCLAQGGGHYGNRTLFEGIKKFPPGHTLVVRHGQTEQLEFKPYFQTKYPVNNRSTDSRPADDLIKKLHAHLFEAVRLRVVSSDVPVGVLLSGGVDSSAVAGMATHVSRERLEANNGAAPPLPTCFTIWFPDDDELDESAIASRTAEHLGLQLEKVAVTEQMLADEFEEACWLGETLLWDLQHIAKKVLSRHISQRGFKVVLNGDGADELFGGYAYLVADRLLEDDKRRETSLQHASSAQRERARQEHVKTMEYYGMQHAADQPDNQAAQVLGLSPSFCKLAVSRHDDWLVSDVRRLSDPFEAILECFSATEIKEMADYHPLHRAMLVSSKTLLPNKIIAGISDGAEMAHSLESRPPFLDHLVAQYSYTLSVDMLVHQEGDKPPVEKWIFREAIKPYVTEEVYGRRKKAFAAPFRWDVGGPLHAKLSSLVTRENIERLGFVDWSKCEDMVDRSFEEKDQLLFRKAIWLAQIVSMGMQFGVQPWKGDRYVDGQVYGRVKGQIEGRTNGQVDGNCEKQPNGWH